MTNSMISYKTTFESTNNLPMQIAIGHGENADLIASFKDEGVDVNLTGYTARAIYQPKSKWGTDDWYELPCEISENTVVAHWGNTYDNGDNAVKLFMHLVKDGKLAYPAIYQIRLFETPGFTPSAIEPIPETIDFSQYTLLNAPWVLPADVPYSVRSIEVDSSYSPSSSYECNTWEIVGITVPSEIVEDYIGIKLPQRNPNKGIDFYVTLQNRTDHAVHLGVVTPSWYEPYAMRSWEPIFEDGLNSLDINAGDTACFHFRETGTISPDFASRYQMVVEKAGYEIKTVYSETPRFSEWVPVNYTFTVEWKESQNHWIFNFNGTEVGDSTGEWANPNATNLSFNYNGIQLEANRTRIDVGYVLGSRSDKPVQPMGDYATIDDVQSVSTVKTIVPDTLGTTINVSAEANHVYGVRPYGSNRHISATFSLPTTQLFDCTFDVDTRDAESEIDLILDTTTFRFLAESGGLVDTIAMNPGGLYRIHLTETTFAMESKPVIYVTREVLWEEVTP